MSKIIKLKVNNLFNLNYNSNTFIYPKIFFDKVYISNSIRNNTIKYSFNLFNNRIQSIQETVNHIKNNTIYFQENNEKLLDIIDREEKALNVIEANIAQINSLNINYKYAIFFKYDNNIKPTLDDFKIIKNSLINSYQNTFINNTFYNSIIKFLINKNFVIEYTEDGKTYYKIPITPFILEYNNYFLNLIFNANYRNYYYINNMEDFYSYNPSLDDSEDNYYKNVEYAIINKNSLNDTQFIQNTYNFILIGDNIPT